MSDRQVIHNNEFISVYYYPDKKIVHHEFHKRASGQVLYDAFTVCAETMEKTRCQKYLSDDRQNSVYAEEDREWSAKNSRPRLIKAGMKYWALLLPEKAIGQLNMKEVIKRYAEQGVTVEVFQDAAKAMEWLERQ